MGYAFFIMGSSDEAKVVLTLQTLKVNLVKSSDGEYKGEEEAEEVVVKGVGGRGKYRGAGRHG